jgi:hypothetical protein
MGCLGFILIAGVIGYAGFEDLRWDFGFADIMKHGGHAQRGEEFSGQPDPLA